MSQTFEPQILNHPLIQHKISLMRKKETGSRTSGSWPAK